MLCYNSDRRKYKNSAHSLPWGARGGVRKQTKVEKRDKSLKINDLQRG